MTKQDRFYNKMFKGLFSLKARYRQDEWYPFLLETKYGGLQIKVENDGPQVGRYGPGQYFTVYCRFMDVERACEGYNPHLGSQLNVHSGKWNFHLSARGKEQNPVFAATYLLDRFRELLPEEPVSAPEPEAQPEIDQLEVFNAVLASMAPLQSRRREWL